jgi:hypothetical protein
MAEQHPPRPIVRKEGDQQQPTQQPAGLVDQAERASPAGPATLRKQNLFTFTIPKSVRDMTPQPDGGPRDPHKVTLRELTDEQQMMAAKVAGAGTDRAEFRAKLAGVSARMSLYSYVADVPPAGGVDVIKVIDHGSSEDEILWRRWSSKVRVLLQQAYGKIHTTSDEEDADFFGSMKASG